MSRPQEAAIDQFLAQNVKNPRAALQPQPGEVHLRAQGQTKYAVIRENRVDLALKAGDKFWQGKVFLETRLTTEWGNTAKTIFVILFNGIPLGEISEFDSKAKDVLDFGIDSSYCGRAVIREDLIGNVVHLFVNPTNRLS